MTEPRTTFATGFGINNRMIREVALTAWFTAMTAYHFSAPAFDGEIIGVDARIYYRAAHAMMHGSDPWAAFATIGTGTGCCAGDLHFAGAPVTIQLFAPFTLMPEGIFVPVWLGVTLASAIYALWRLGLPGTWLLFPPISEALISGNPQLTVLALLVSGHSLLQAPAVGLKAYAAVPMIGERWWRALVVSVGLLVLSGLIAADRWSEYIQNFAPINARLLEEAAGGYSAWGLPLPSLLLTVAALGVIAIFDRRAAGWLVVPAIWPASEIHYSTFALPVISAPLGFVLAIPQRGIPAIAVIGLAVWHLGRHAIVRGSVLGSMSSRLRGQ